jgi:AcrR family transcriptional regulator
VSDPATLRSDAARNRARILAAASELFAESGADLSVDEIARRAGVGHATVFRRFPTKEDLVVAMFEERLLEVARVAEEAEALEDPWDGLRTAMEHIAAKQVCDRGLFEAVATEMIGSPRLREARHRVMQPFERLLRRAQDAGMVRGDLEPPDVIFLVTAAGHAAPCRIDLPDVWRRYLAVIFDGMRPAGASPLPAAAPTVAQLDEALEAAATRCEPRSSSA